MTGRWRILSILVTFALVLGACGGAPATTAPQNPTSAADAPAAPAEAATAAPQASAATPSILRIGYGASPDKLNPGTAVLAAAYTIFALVYDSLYLLQLDGSYKPVLAESADTSQDGKTWTFKIRQGVTFHDGTPLTAKDVVFSYTMYKTHEDFPYLTTYPANFESIEAPDDSTVVITLSEPVPNMEYLLSYLYIVPEQIWGKLEAKAQSEFTNEAMIGSGPFKMVEYRQNEFVHLAANKEYYMTPPKVDEIIFQTFQNQDAVVQALVTGQVDMITEMSNTAVATLRNDPNIKLVIGAPLAPNVSDIIMNQISQENCPLDSTCTGHPALKDRNVRLALAHATDKQKLIDVAVLGLGVPGLTLIPDGLGQWYNNTIQDYPFDIARANQILDEAGYKDADGDGVREMPDGQNPLIFRIYWPDSSDTAPRRQEILAETWGQIGVKLEPKAFDSDALTSVCCPAFDYDIILWSWASDPDPNLLLAVPTTEGITTGNNETGYSNPEYDQLYLDQTTALDPEKRKEIVWKMQEIIHNDVVYIIPYYDQGVQAYRVDRFTGWKTDGAKIELSDPSSLLVIEPVK